MKKAAATGVVVLFVLAGLGRPAFGQVPKTNEGTTSSSNAELLRELEQMRRRIQELEEKLKGSQESDPPSSVANVTAQETAPSGPTRKRTPAEPFAFTDWSWLTGNPRT